MVTRDTPWPDGTPCWVELAAPDPRMAIDFYGALFAWDFADQGDETGNYLLALLGGRSVAGVGSMPAGQEDAPAAWTTYLATSDVDRAVSRISENGGRVTVAPMDVWSAGRLAMATDPDGAPFGLWQAGEHRGVGVANVAGTVCWNECRVRDFERAQQFYAGTFGYAFDDVSAGGIRGAVLKLGENVVGGIVHAPAEDPHWSVYFAAADTDETVARVTEVGGRLVREPRDSPFGRIALVGDNQGAGFHLITAPETS